MTWRACRESANRARVTVDAGLRAAASEAVGALRQGHGSLRTGGRKLDCEPDSRPVLETRSARTSVPAGRHLRSGTYSLCSRDAERRPLHLPAAVEVSTTALPGGAHPPVMKRPASSQPVPVRLHAVQSRVSAVSRVLHWSAGRTMRTAEDLSSPDNQSGARFAGHTFVCGDAMTSPRCGCP